MVIMATSFYGYHLMFFKLCGCAVFKANVCMYMTVSCKITLLSSFSSFQFNYKEPVSKDDSIHQSTDFDVVLLFSKSVHFNATIYFVKCNLCTVASCVLFFSDFIISYTFECEPFFSIACQCFKVLIMIEIVVYALTRIFIISIVPLVSVM